MEWVIKRLIKIGAKVLNQGRISLLPDTTRLRSGEGDEGILVDGDAYGKVRSSPVPKELFQQRDDGFQVFLPRQGPTSGGFLGVRSECRDLIPGETPLNWQDRGISRENSTLIQKVEHKERQMGPNLDILERINCFPRWHYQFDLMGHLTPIFAENHINRHAQRKKYFLDPTVSWFGGSLAGKRVLDLGCNAGFWSLCVIQAGCDYVLGIDGRQMHIDQANFVFEVNSVERSRYDFLVENVLDISFQPDQKFDIVLCLGPIVLPFRKIEVGV